jgi:sec-independent protein translocase protein TatC
MTDILRKAFALLAKYRRITVVTLTALLVLTLALYFISDALISRISVFIAPHVLTVLSPAEGFLSKVTAALFTSALILPPFIMFLLAKRAFGVNRTVITLLSVLFSVAGWLFCDRVFMPNALRLLLLTIPGEFEIRIAMLGYVRFITAFYLITVAVFQLPLVMFALYRGSVLSPRKLNAARKYFYLLDFIVMAILTPPDVFSMLMASLPVIILFELAALMIWIMEKIKKR